MSMDLARLSQLLGEPGPFASVYFDEADDVAASLTLQWRALRDKLEQYGAGRIDHHRNRARRDERSSAHRAR
jgi:hypothetical protein